MGKSTRFQRTKWKPNGNVNANASSSSQEQTSTRTGTGTRSNDNCRSNYSSSPFKKRRVHRGRSRSNAANVKSGMGMGIPSHTSSSRPLTRSRPLRNDGRDNRNGNGNNGNGNNRNGNNRNANGNATKRTRTSYPLSKPRSRSRPFSRSNRSTSRSASLGNGNKHGNKHAHGNAHNHLPNNLNPIRVSKNSIHSHWKKELGGIIRYYIHHQEQNYNCSPRESEQEVERMYTRNGCSIEDTKDAILIALGASKSKLNGNGNGSNVEKNGTNKNMNMNMNEDERMNDRNELDLDWINISMMVEGENENENEVSNADADAANADIDIVSSNNNKEGDGDGKGNKGRGNGRGNGNGRGKPKPKLKLKGIPLATEKRAGEGPAHSGSTWTNVIVPPWAIGKPYYFHVTNRSNINLSAEVFIDGHKVAKNAPVPSTTARTIRPDNTRYCESHKWVLQPAKRVKLQPKTKTKVNGNIHMDEDVAGKNGLSVSVSVPTQTRRRRYNGVRPNYDHKRVPIQQYPDPTDYGWTFTGSVEASYVEFFQQVTNMGGLIQMDFYYTTGTVKTVMDHPTTGRNELFRNTVSSEDYIRILKNPRSHTGRGYRQRVNRGADITIASESNATSTRTHTHTSAMTTYLEELENFEEEGGASKSNTEDEDEDMNMDMNMDDDNKTATFYAKNDTYNFKTDGHRNRRLEMSNLQKDAHFQAWEEAARQEYAVVHAKFYISVPKQVQVQRHRRATSAANSNYSRNGNGNGRQRNKESLPEQAPVVDLKATEGVGLGTKFHSLGPSESNSNLSKQRSNVKMNRIQGLNDDDDWRGGPLFECKLYYRAENYDIDNDDDDDDELEMDDDNERGESMNNITDSNSMDADMAGTAMGIQDLRQNVPMDVYKLEKIDQVKQFFAESAALVSPREAEVALNNCQSKIRLAGSMDDIDELVKIYHDGIIRERFHGVNECQ